MAKNLSSNLGYFITFEGPDGCGKTTIAKEVFKILEKQYPNKVVLTREPGGKNNIIAEEIRNILLNHIDYKIDKRAEALLFAASRAQHVNDFILPKLKEGNIVLCDRYIHSSLVYQGYVRNLGIKEVLDINKFAIQNTMPCLVILIMLEPEKCFERIKQNSRDMNRLDRESINLHNKVYEGYKNLANKYPESICVVDGSGSIQEVTNQVIKILKDKIKI